jgi:tRNA(fMet)-specific endonuclease VapC
LKYLLDTNVLSEVLKRRSSPAVMTRLRRTRIHEIATSVVCVMELRAGAARDRRGPAPWTKIESELLAGVELLSFGIEEAAVAGDITAELEEAGTPIGVEDVQIAATARRHGLTVATRNVRHLRRVRGLDVEDWWS